MLPAYISLAHHVEAVSVSCESIFALEVSQSVEVALAILEYICSPFTVLRLVSLSHLSPPNDLVLIFNFEARVPLQ